MLGYTLYLIPCRSVAWNALLSDVPSILVNCCCISCGYAPPAWSYFHKCQIRSQRFDMAGIAADARVYGPAVCSKSSLRCCCDRFQEVARLAAENRFDYVLIESTGISEPMPVAATFSVADDAGRSLSDFTRLDTMVRHTHEPDCTTDRSSTLLCVYAW